MQSLRFIDSYRVRRGSRFAVLRCEALEQRRLLAVLLGDTFPVATFNPANWSLNSGAGIDTLGNFEPTPTLSARLNTTPNPGDELRSVTVNLAAEESVKLKFFLQLGGQGGVPDFLDDFFVEYRDASNNWIELLKQSGGFSIVQYAQVEAILPDAALHSTFQFRFRVFRGGGGSDTDDYFVDDVSLETIPAAIRGVKWSDLDGDGTQDQSEPVLPGWQIYLDLDEDGQYDSGVEPVRTTDVNGEYAFDNLAGGTYTVGEVAQSGFTTTFPSLQNPDQPPWIELGPAPILFGQTYGNEQVSGRLVSIAVHPTDPNTIYVAGANGGVWKTTNSGQSWTPLTDDQPTLAMGHIALAPSNPSIIYAGTGEAHFSGDSIYGRGVLKSTDGGDTWTLLGQQHFDRRAISKVIVDPSNPNIVYVSTTRAVNSLAGNRGVWKTIDGGTTWTELTTSISSNASVTDLIMDPTNSNTLYAAFGEVRGDVANGVYKTTNAGASWNRIGTGTLPEGTPVGRTILAISSNGQTLYASFAGGASSFGALIGFYQSNNAGANWTNRTGATPNYLGSQGWYDSTLVVDPTNSQIVYAGGGGGPNELLRSNNGGANWTFIGEGVDQIGPHVDHHALVFDSLGRLLNGNDGGIWRTSNAGSNWEDLNSNLGITQFYGISIHPTSPHIAIGGTQDNGTLAYVGTPGFQLIAYGDGGITAIDQQNPNTIYQEYQYVGDGWINRSDDGGLTFHEIDTGILFEPGRFIIPYEMDASNSSHLVLGTNRVYETNNRGDLWTPISNKLTAAANAVIAALEIAPSNPDVIYASYTDGTVWVTTNGGTNWAQRQIGLPSPSDPLSGGNVGAPRGPEELPPGVPGIVGVGDFAVNPLNASIAYLIRDQFTSGKVFRTADAGLSWANITSNLPDLPVNSVQIDTRFGSTIFVGTDAGVYRSLDDGASWQLYGQSLPNTLVQDLEINLSRGVLAAGTHGRGIWQTAVRQVNSPNVHTVFVAAGTQVDGINFGNRAIDVIGPSTPGITLASGGVHAPYSVPVGNGEQLRTVPIARMDRITIAFNEPVVVEQNDLSLVGISTSYTFAGFSYDSFDDTATWFLTAPMDADELELTLSDDVRDLAGNALDGEWDNPTSLIDASSDVFPAGNGVPGGPLVFRFTVLSGDATRDNVVTGADFTIWADRFDNGVGPGNKPFTDADFTGDGFVTGADFTEWADHFGINQTAPGALLPVEIARTRSVEVIKPTEERPALRPEVDDAPGLSSIAVARDDRPARVASGAARVRALARRVDPQAADPIWEGFGNGRDELA